MFISLMRYPKLDHTKARNALLAASLLGICFFMAGCSDGDSSSTSENEEEGTDEATMAAIAAGLRINEIVASNQLGLADEDGDTSDWIELYNPSNTAFDLTDWHLSDDPEDLSKWTFPPLSLPANGYLVVFASDKERATAGAELHTNFKLSADGEYLALANPAGTVAVDEFAPTFPALLEDQAYGVRSDGTAGILTPPSPGAANTP